MDPMLSSQALRVIGQYLVKQKVQKFHIERHDSKFFVWVDDAIRANDTRRTGLLKNLSKLLHQNADTTEIIPTFFRFDTYQLELMDVSWQTHRKLTDEISDFYELSTVLRVIGHYLDRKGVINFKISFESDAINVIFEGRKETFSFENLYDFGVHMYLKRSRRGDHREVDRTL